MILHRVFALSAAFLVTLSPIIHADIAADWKKFSGGKEARVIFLRSNGIYELNLSNGKVTKLATITNHGFPKYSPDGSRIAVFGQDGSKKKKLWVMNSDGSDLRVAVSSIYSALNDQYGGNWYDNNWVAYAGPGRQVVKTRINETNSGVETKILISKKRPYFSVEALGDYVCCGVKGISRQGFHVPTVIKISTGETHHFYDVDRSGCNVHLKPDASGVCMYTKAGHKEIYIRSFSPNKITKRINRRNNTGRWSNHKSYVIVNGFKDAPKKAWVVNVDNGRNLYLGNDMRHPDLFIGKVSVSRRVATPVITPNGGAFAGSIPVEIRSAGTGAQIYYTLNGATPTISGIRYSGPITLSSSATIKARAFRNGNPSAIATAVFTKRQRKPAETFANPTPGVRYAVYAGHWKSVPDFLLLSPVADGVTSGIDPAIAQKTTDFGLRFEGYAFAPQSDVYSFSVLTSGKAKLSVGSTPIVDNASLPSNTMANGSIELEQGFHAISLSYVHTSGSPGLMIGWGGPSISASSNLAQSLFYSSPVSDAKLRLVAPNGGEVFAFGDTISIVHTPASEQIGYPAISVNNGRTWIPMFSDNDKIESVPGLLKWVVPADPALLCDTALIQIFLYVDPTITDRTDRSISIVRQTALRPGVRINHGLYVSDQERMFLTPSGRRIPGRGNHAIGFGIQVGRYQNGARYSIPTIKLGEN